MTEYSRREFLKAAVSVPAAFIYGQQPREVDCPIFYFHEIPNSRVFGTFVYNLLIQGWQPIKLAQLTDCLVSGYQTWSGQPFILSFDDGRLSQKEYALPYLLNNQIPAVFAVMPNWGGDGVQRFMTNQDLRELSDLGMEVISHTFHHPHLPRLRAINQGAWAAEIVQSRQALEDITGNPIQAFCYPYGAYDQATVELVAQYYQVALSTRPGSMQKIDYLFLLKRTAVT